MTTKWIGDFGYNENGKCVAIKLQRNELPDRLSAEDERMVAEALGVAPLSFSQRARIKSLEKAKSAGVDLDREYK